jgi:hypothetical protein
MNRVVFNRFLSLIAGAIALSSAAATYSIQRSSWQDWPPAAATALALCATLAIEALFMAVFYGLSHVLAGSVEKILGALTMAGLIVVMAINFTLHRAMVIGAPLSGWQVAYIEWSGAAVLFVILAVVVCFQLFSLESRDRRIKRDLSTIATERALEWQRSALESEELNEYLEASKPAVYAQVMRRLELPAAPRAIINADQMDQRGAIPKAPGKLAK